jgi:hypothetical protein
MQALLVLSGPWHHILQIAKFATRALFAVCLRTREEGGGKMKPWQTTKTVVRIICGLGENIAE